MRRAPCLRDAPPDELDVALASDGLVHGPDLPRAAVEGEPLARRPHRIESRHESRVQDRDEPGLAIDELRRAERPIRDPHPPCCRRAGELPSIRVAPRRGARVGVGVSRSSRGASLVVIADARDNLSLSERHPGLNERADGPRAALDVRGPERVESEHEALDVELAPELVSCDPRDRLDGAEDVLSPCLAQERPVRPPQERDRDATAREDVFSEHHADREG